MITDRAGELRRCGLPTAQDEMAAMNLSEVLTVPKMLSGLRMISTAAR
jgi:hypothetical protein